MATSAQNKEFTSEMFPLDPLDAAIDWIASHLEPEDVFDDEALSTWALEHGFIFKPSVA